MRRTTYYVFVTAALTVLAACSLDENLMEPIRKSVPVTLTCSTLTAIETRAAQDLNEGTFSSGETVKISISNTGAYSWTSYDFTTGNAGTMSPAGSVPYYPEDSHNIDIAAYYPATAGTSFSVQTDQTGDTDYKASDLMFASVSNQSKQDGAVNMAFTHKLAKLNVNITAGSGVDSIIGVSILNIKPIVSFNQITGEVGDASGEATAILVSNNGAAVIPAQTVSGGLLSISTDKGTATYTVASKEFAAGQQYRLNITVNLRNIGTTNAINEWTGNGSVTVYSERPKIAGHEYVDMGTVTINGVEKNLKWATCNLGAYNPWENGDYYTWAATTPQTYYYWENYPYMQEGKDDWKYITKYTFDDGQTEAIWYEDAGNFIGDNKTSLADNGYLDDAARQQWGDTWRVPTYLEWAALNDQTLYDWGWKTDYLGTGKNGMLITRKDGPCAGNSVFLPAAGFRRPSTLEGIGSNGYYWTSELYYWSDIALDFYLDYSISGLSYTERKWGFSIRPVSE